MESIWARTGSRFAWLGAVSLVVGIVLMILGFVLGLVPPNFDADRAGSPELMAELLTAWRSAEILHHVFAGFFILGDLALIALGLALRELFGRGMPRSEILFASLFAGALIRVAGGLLGEGTIAGSSTLSGQVEGDALVALGTGFELVRGHARWWFFSTANLLVGVGVFLASRLATEQGKLSRRWAYLGYVLAVVFWLDFLGRFSGLEGLAEGMNLLGLLLIVAWLIWLGFGLRRVAGLAGAEHDIS